MKRIGYLEIFTQIVAQPCECVFERPMLRDIVSDTWVGKANLEAEQHCIYANYNVDGCESIFSQQKMGFIPPFYVFFVTYPPLFLVPHPYIETVDFTSETVVGVIYIFVVRKILVDIRQKEPVV